jgi:ribA/ribD-fused uncharacterized protein
MKNKFTFFWGGPFSQWAKSRFKIDGVVYNTTEQYMMAQKALLFNDTEIFDQIMSESNPKEQKALGRKIKGFNKEVWEAECRNIVFNGNYAKFTQNDDLYKELMATVGTELVEASTEDPIWGIGLAETDSRAWDKSTWLGTNWLGEAITAVRDKLIAESKSDEDYLKEEGWVVECESPFEIRHNESGSFASGHAAYAVIRDIKANYNADEN